MDAISSCHVPHKFGRMNLGSQITLPEGWREIVRESLQTVFGFAAPWRAPAKITLLNSADIFDFFELQSDSSTVFRVVNPSLPDAIFWDVGFRQYDRKKYSKLNTDNAPEKQNERHYNRYVAAQQICMNLQLDLIEIPPAQFAEIQYGIAKVGVLAVKRFPMRGNEPSSSSFCLETDPRKRQVDQLIQNYPKYYQWGMGDFEIRIAPFVGSALSPEELTGVTLQRNIVWIDPVHLQAPARLILKVPDARDTPHGEITVMDNSAKL